LSHEVCFLVGFPEGEGVADHDGLIEDFDEVVDAIVAEEVILEAL
jgi:predicted NAD/FAD-binding protein